jgi:hypothetical protein
MSLYDTNAEFLLSYRKRRPIHCDYYCSIVLPVCVLIITDSSTTDSSLAIHSSKAEA